METPKTEPATTPPTEATIGQIEPPQADAGLDLPRIAGRIFGAPLLIEPTRFEGIVSVLSPRLAGEKFEAKDSSDRQGRDKLTVVDGVAVIPIMGSLVHRHDWLSALCGMTSYEQLHGQIDEAIDSAQVEAILFDIDSPGGEVSGCFDLADHIHAAREKKPIWAVTSGMAASAAYALGSSAERLYVTQTAIAGSIGVIMAHRDQSARNAKEGIKYTSIYAGARKADLNPHEPLSPDAKASAQALIDEIYGIFVGAVARNRGLSAEQVRATEAGVFMGAKAVEAGLADGIATYSQVLAMLREQTAGPDSHSHQPSQERIFMTTTDTTTPADKSAEIEATRKKAQEDERQRSQAILKAAAKLGAPIELAQKLVADGTPLVAAVEQLSDHAAAASPTNGINGARGEGEDASADDLPIEEAAAREFDRDPKLRKEFSSKETYVAYRAATARKLVKAEIKVKNNR